MFFLSLAPNSNDNKIQIIEFWMYTRRCIVMVLFFSMHIIDQVAPGRGKVEPFVSILSHKEGSTEVFPYLMSYSLQYWFDLMLSVASSTWKMHCV